MPTPVPTVRQSPSIRTAVFALVATVALVVGAGACSDDEATPTTTTEASGSDGDDAAGGETTSTDATTTTGDDGSTTTEAPTPTDPDGGDAGPLPELTAVEQPYADAIIEDFSEDGEFLPGADNTCLATRWVHAIGGDALSASGLSPDDFADDGPAAVGIDRGTAEEMVDSMSACNAGVDRFYDLFASPGGNVPDPDDTTAEQRTMVACMKDAVPLSELRDALVTSFMGDDDVAMSAVTDKWSACAPGEG